MFKRNKALYFMMSILALAILLVGCGKATEEEPAETTTETPKEEPKEQAVDYSADVKENPVVTITMENDEQIVLELEPTVAPNSVANFISLIEDGYYDGLIFHRVIPGFMIQGGDSSGDGTGGPGYSIDGEFSSNGFENNMKHERGVLSMARAQDPNSAGSQFFIMTDETASLDGEYAAFGKVIEGMETVDAIVANETDAMDKPVEEQKMKTVEVDTKGFDYPKPTTH
ncbi:peptidylprolyl isomerase [Sporosarcina sp. P26b]|uniref:peptidylprolyl isomerase n=1 Tax=Sporosarcina TaxID=1569 RepID=UPI000A17D000|nr:MULTISPECIES: peptidylprolyl isomerase [Sporosarcina]ARK21727.1 peptidylprolyl isomerase [Sporosarcina ureae]PIC74595.1 peptidylprolyl isomerase [Sporosarcina sp. P17b]PIC95761.1 peptidylprolyl isomerase [Sporosarcina sp. P26b]